MKKTVLMKVKPMYTRVVTTADKYTEEDAINESGILQANKIGVVKDVQTVLAINERTAEMGVNVGDRVLLNFSNYIVRKMAKNSLKEDLDEIYNEVVRYEFPMLEIDEKECLLLNTSDIVVVVLETRDVEIKPASNILIVPEGTVKV